MSKNMSYFLVIFKTTTKIWSSEEKSMTLIKISFPFFLPTHIHTDTYLPHPYQRQYFKKINMYSKVESWINT